MVSFFTVISRAGNFWKKWMVFFAFPIKAVLDTKRCLKNKRNRMPKNIEGLYLFKACFFKRCFAIKTPFRACPVTLSLIVCTWVNNISKALYPLSASGASLLIVSTNSVMMGPIARLPPIKKPTDAASISSWRVAPAWMDCAARAAMQYSQ